MKHEITLIFSFILINLLSVPCAGDTGCFFTDDTTESVEVICSYSSGKDATQSCYSWNYEGSTWNAHRAKVKKLTVKCIGTSMNADYFGAFFNVEVLDVSNFGIKYLESASLNMKNLKNFNASHNKLNQLSGSAFIHLPNLEEADFSFNQLSILDTTTFSIFTKLKILDLSNNLIKTLDTNLFTNNKELELLRLDSNPIQKFEFLVNLMTSPSVNITMNQVQRLDTSSLNDSVQVEVSESDDEVIFRSMQSDSKVVMSIESFGHLNYLNISGNQLIDIEYIVDLLGSSIETLDVSANFIGKLNVQTFEKFINLKQLNLKNTSLTTISFDQFTNVSFSTYNTKLESLNLEENPIVRFDCNLFKTLKSLVAVQVSCDSIEEIDTSCMGNGLNLYFSGEKVIFRVFRDSAQYSELQCAKDVLQNVRYLNVSSNELKTTPLIIESLGSPIETLDMSLNFIGEWNVEILEKFTNLKYLNLRQTQLSQISSNTAHHGSFHGNGNKLQELYMDQNPIERVDCNMFLMLMSSMSAEISWENVKDIDTSCMGELLQIDLNEEEEGNEVIFHILHDTSELHCPKKHFQNLVKFNISRNRLNNTLKIIDLLDSSLQTLDVSLNFMGKLNGKTFKNLNNLQYLNLSHTNLSNFGFDTFYHLNKLKTLDLSFNWLKKVDFTLLLRNFKDMITLNIEGNDLNNIDSVTQSNFPKLTSLGISKNRFDCLYLANFLRQWERLQLFHNPSDQTHIDGIDCYHYDQSINGEDYIRKNQDIIANSHNIDSTLIERNHTTENDKLAEEAETPKSVVTVKPTKTTDSHKTATSSELRKTETPTIEISTNKISEGSGKNATEPMHGPMSTINERTETEKIKKIMATEFERMKSNAKIKENNYSADTSSSILGELRILKFILLIICCTYLVVKTKVVQRIKQMIAKSPEENGDIAHQNGSRNSRNAIELIEHTENNLKEKC